jgi:hypothetical protein
VVGLYGIGKERVALAVASALGERISSQDPFRLGTLQTCGIEVCEESGVVAASLSDMGDPSVLQKFLREPYG